MTPESDPNANLSPGKDARAARQRRPLRSDSGGGNGSIQQAVGELVAVAEVDSQAVPDLPAPLPPPVPADRDLGDPSLYINRELSLIEFNRRVLEEAFRHETPLLERVKFLAIFSNNMDEFFMVRVSGLLQQVLLGVSDAPADGLTPREQIVAIHRVVTELVDKQMAYWTNTVLPELESVGIHVLHYDDLKKRAQKRLTDYFEEEIFPVLTPLAFDPGHPFPHISNLSLNLAVAIRDPETKELHFARVKVPSTLPRLLPLRPLDPDELLTPAVQKFVWVEDVIAANLDSLFPGMEIVAAYPFRVTRNTDMEIQEEEADDLMMTLEENLRQRHFGHAVRLEVDGKTPEDVLDTLLTNLQIGQYQLFAIDGPLGLSNLWELHGLERPGLKDPSFQPATPERLRTNDDIFSVIRRQDILLHHPYDSFAPVVDFVRSAAHDPDVLAIKMTLYRVGPKPPIVHALMEARENGKQVAALVELKARFDEESNIVWARALERAGVHVVYGIIGLKTHCKLALVVRRERDRIRRYVHLSTGNYNASTARVYTDLGLMTCDDDIGADTSELFNFLTGYSKQQEYRKFLVAPHRLREKLLAFIKQEAQFGSNGHIVIKLNSLVDPRLIRALYRASQAGVKIELIVRGICCLRPGVPGVSENIRVVSVVGRFLEHSRIYFFNNDGDPLLYVGSADLMPGKLDRRVEVLFPTRDQELQERIVGGVLKSLLRDVAQAHELQESGQYVALREQLAEGEPQFDAQRHFLATRAVDNPYIP